MTNILATVAILFVTTTNDVPRYEAMEMSDGESSWMTFFDNSKVPEPDKFFTVPMISPYGISTDSERVRIIKKKRTTTLSFHWNGKERKIVDEKTLSEKRLLLKQEWNVANR